MAYGRCENARCFATFHVPFHIWADFFSGLLMCRRHAAVRSATFAMMAVVSAPWWEAPSFAHRLDELFQAARVTIESERVVIDLDLTPGMQAAPQLIDLLDADGDGDLSGIEGLNFAR